MGIELDLSGLKRAEERLSRIGLEIVRECADECRDVAQENARVDEDDMRQGIKSVPTDDGADVVANDPKTVFHEWGTGIYAGDSDPQYPGQRKSTGSRAEEIPWVYTPDEGRTFYTTYGVRPRPMLRPGHVAAKRRFQEEKRRRGL